MTPTPGSTELRRHQRWSGRRSLIVASIAAAATLGIAVASRSGQARPSFLLLRSHTKPPVHRVAKTSLAVKVNGVGMLESSKSREVVNQVEGQSTILFLAPEGSTVRKGELVCELDSAVLRDSLTNQVITTRTTEAAVRTSTETREVAEMALKEYLGGTYPQDLRNAEITRKLAETNLTQATDRLDWSIRMFEKGFLPRAQLQAERDSKANCEIALANAMTKLRVLSTYTRRKTLSELQASIQKARADELSKLASLGLEQAKQRKLQNQVARCKMYAPTDGLVTYVNDNMTRPGASAMTIEEGASVRERQAIIRIPDITQMRVKMKIDESQVNRIAAGKKAQIQIDALPGVLLEGTVSRVQQIADPPQPPMVEIRSYTALVDIHNPPSSVRPAMSAHVAILASQASDVLTTPFETIFQTYGVNSVNVLTPEGVVQRSVTLGASDSHQIEILSGVSEGEELILNPLTQMSDARRKALLADDFTIRDHGETAKPVDSVQGM